MTSAAQLELQRCFESRSDYRFLDDALFRQALTHRSYATEHGADHNERLEFLGDAVLGVACGSWLFHHFEEVPEGLLARRKSYLVSWQVLAALARDLDVGKALLLGFGEEQSGGREKPSLLADAMEALIGALYLEGGLAPVQRLLEPFFEEKLASEPLLEGQDAKTRLQEFQQARGSNLPVYRVLRSSGPDHDKEFEVECLIDGRRRGIGVGGSKKKAELAAAVEALETLPAGN